MPQGTATSSKKGGPVVSRTESQKKKIGRQSLEECSIAGQAVLCPTFLIFGIAGLIYTGIFGNGGR